MKKSIESVIDIPDHIDGELLELLLYLSDEETNMVKGIVTGMLMVYGSISSEELNAIHAKYKK